MKRSRRPIESLFAPVGIETAAGFFGVLLIGLFAALQTGATAIWPDTLYYADRARHLLEQGSFIQSAAYPLATQPLYSLFMLIAFLFQDIQFGHLILIALQSCCLALGFFPLRLLLLKKTNLNEREAWILSAGGILLPTFFSYAPILTAEVALIPLLLCAVYYIDQWLDAPKDKQKALGTGVFLGLAILTHNSAWILWLATFAAFLPSLSRLKTAPTRQTLALAFGIPVGLFLLWTGYLYGVEGRSYGLDLSLNNTLARFNFVKNALFYYVYGGAPMAGMVLLLAAFLKRKSFWENPFLRLSFITLLLLSFYVAFTTPVIVERKLDYLTNRTLEPYLFLPLIGLFRLEEGTRKELLGNSLLLFFVLMIFGMPYVLQLDFNTGLAFWSGPFPGTATPLIRNILYLLAISGPVLLIYMRPRWFLAGYAFLLFFMAAAGLATSSSYWKHNDAAHVSSMDAHTLYSNPVMRAADHIYVNYRCHKSENNDVAYLFGCFDLGKAVYFLPRLPEHITPEELLKLPAEKLDNAFFASTENDNVFGKMVAQSELARFMLLTRGRVQSMRQTPLVHITKISGMEKYISLPMLGHPRRVTVLKPKSEFALHSNRAGCVRMEASFFMAESQPIFLKLGEGSVRKITPPTLKQVSHKPVEIKLDLPEGSSALSIEYGEKGKNPLEQPSLILIDRPMFNSCKSGE